MELKSTNHSYYSSDTNYYANSGDNYGSVSYENWQEFKTNWLDADLKIDHDYNHLFRFDILPQTDPKTDEHVKDAFSLKLFYVLQRKGIYRPVYIHSISQDDMVEIQTYLSDCWSYLQNQWNEISSLTP